MFDVIRRMWRRNAFMAVVVGKERGTPRADDVLGVITKDHVADLVAASIQIYPGEHQPARRRQGGTRRCPIGIRRRRAGLSERRGV